MPGQTNPLKDPDAGDRADREAPEAERSPSATNSAAASSAAAAPPARIPLDKILNPNPIEVGYDMFSTWSNSQNKVPPTGAGLFRPD